MSSQAIGSEPLICEFCGLTITEDGQKCAALDESENGGRGGVQALPEQGEHGATLYATDGVPTSGVADLEGVTANDPVWGSYTWSLAIRDPHDGDYRQQETSTSLSASADHVIAGTHIDETDSAPE